MAFFLAPSQPHRWHWSSVCKHRLFAFLASFLQGICRLGNYISKLTCTLSQGGYHILPGAPKAHMVDYFHHTISATRLNYFPVRLSPSHNCKFHIRHLAYKISVTPFPHWSTCCRHQWSFRVPRSLLRDMKNLVTEFRIFHLPCRRAPRSECTAPGD